MSNTRHCKRLPPAEDPPPERLARMWMPGMCSPTVFCAFDDPELNARTLDAVIMLAQGTGYRCEPC